DRDPRRAAEILGQPLRAAHGGRRVAAASPEVALAASPEAAHWALLRQGAERGHAVEEVAALEAQFAERLRAGLENRERPVVELARVERDAARDRHLRDAIGRVDLGSDRHLRGALE